MDIIKTITISDIVSVIALLLSVLSIVMTIIYNRTAHKLNKKLLDKEIQDIDSKKKADISADFIKIGSGYRLKIFNKGFATAKNIFIGFPFGNEILLDSEIDEKFPIDTLEQNQEIYLIAGVTLQSPRKMRIRLEWADEANLKNEKEFSVYIS